MTDQQLNLAAELERMRGRVEAHQEIAERMRRITAKYVEQGDGASAEITRAIGLALVKRASTLVGEGQLQAAMLTASLMGAIATGPPS